MVYTFIKVVTNRRKLAPLQMIQKQYRNGIYFGSGTKMVGVK